MNAAPTTPALANDAPRGSHWQQRIVGASGPNRKYPLDISAYVAEHGGMMKTQNGNHKPAAKTQLTADQLRHWADCMDNAELPKPDMVNPSSSPELLAALKYITTQAWWSEGDHLSATNMEARLNEILATARDAIAKSEGK